VRLEINEMDAGGVQLVDDQIPGGLSVQLTVSLERASRTEIQYMPVMSWPEWRVCRTMRRS